MIIRLAFGLAVAAHGAQKLFGTFEGPGLQGWTGMMGKLGIRPERPFAVASAVNEFGGGLLVAIGFLMPIGPLAVAASMAVAAVAVHLPRGFWNQQGGYEYPLLVLAAMLGLSLTGPGALSLDYALGLQLPEPATWIVVAILAGLGAAGALASRARGRELA